MRSIEPVVEALWVYSTQRHAQAPWAFVAEGFDARIREANSAWGIPHDAELRVEWSGVHGAFVSVEFSAVGTSVAPVTAESLREMPVARLLALACQAIPDLIIDEAGRDLGSLNYYSGEQLATARSAGPTPDTLEMVARVYLGAAVTRRKPARYVAWRFDLPPRTATHWIKLAKERAHLPLSVAIENSNG